MLNLRLKAKMTIKSNVIHQWKAMTIQNSINFTNYTFIQNLRLQGKQQQKTRVVLH